MYIYIYIYIYIYTYPVLNRPEQDLGDLRGAVDDDLAGPLQEDDLGLGHRSRPS